MADKKNLLLLFDRPQEPVFMEKGNKAVFDIPDNFLTDRYKPIGNEVQSRFGEKAEQRIPVNNISIPDLRIPMSLGRNEQFSLFVPRHRRIAGRLIDIFMGKWRWDGPRKKVVRDVFLELQVFAQSTIFRVLQSSLVIVSTLIYSTMRFLLPCFIVRIPKDCVYHHLWKPSLTNMLTQRFSRKSVRKQR